MIRTLTILATLLVAVAASAVELSDSQRAAIEERIAPIGDVCLQGDTSCGGPAVAVSSGPRSGQEVFDAACMACHSTGAGGAPIKGDVDAWAARIAKGIDTLHQHGIEGIPGTGMMAKGGCVNCSDEEVIAAVDYMVEESQ
ncbi:cytochrome c5 family protein [Parahaliea maris]|uniref:Cytochrome c5 family protein n=1 Tax=Parahaliea maris TaxID=2716870 RepID=A0A5C9A0D7_9GAMM|nr:c-type cytochrome [Parahaliea maris]TXS94218.1 cytochrome c5 family protein [Parahaliea maris]